MAKTQLARTGASQWSVDTDAWPARTGWNNELANFNAVVAVYGQGATASRPLASRQGFYYFATDTQRLWYDNGTTWTEVSPVGGGGTPQPSAIGTAGSEGTSRIAARADHVHALSDPTVDPAAVTYGGAAGRGSSATPARADHSHALAQLPFAGTAAAPLAVGGSGAVGTATTLARADHGHTLPVPDLDPGALTPGSTVNRGTSSTPARADHTHAVTALPIATSAAPPAAVDIGDAAAVGVSTSLARADHQHAFPASAVAPPSVGYGQSGAVGSATTAARSDHTHTLAALPLATSPPAAETQGAPGAVGVSTLLARADHQHAMDTLLIGTGGGGTPFNGGQAGMFTGNAPPNWGQMKIFAWHGVFICNINGDIDVQHSGFVNGTLMPQAFSIDHLGSSVMSIQPLWQYSYPTHTGFRCFNYGGGVSPGGTQVRVVGSIWGW